MSIEMRSRDLSRPMGLCQMLVFIEYRFMAYGIAYNVPIL